MVGTRSNPHRKLDKEFLHSRAPGNIKKHRAKHTAPSSSPLPPLPSEPVLVYGRPLPSTPPITPVINLTGRLPGKPNTRRDHPTCLDYRLFRRLMFPGSLFCSPCNEWEEQLHLKCHLKNKIRAKMYACQCEHTSFVEPSSVYSSMDVPFDKNRSLFAKSSNKPHPLPTKYKQYNPLVLLCNSNASSTTRETTNKANDKLCNTTEAMYIRDGVDGKLPSLKDCDTEPQDEQINNAQAMEEHNHYPISCVNQTELKPVYDVAIKENDTNPSTLESLGSQSDEM